MRPSDYDRMMAMITGHWITQIVHATAKYSLADHLALGPATAADIAKKAGTHPSATFRLLRTCASLGLVTCDGDSRFVTTSLLDTLRTDNPQSLRDMALVLAGSGQWLPWGRFAEAIKAEHPQAVAALGKEAFDYLAERPDESQAFIGATTRGLAPVTREVARLLDTRSSTVEAFESVSVPSSVNGSRQPGIDGDAITARQRDVLSMIGQGHSNKRIARTLEISPETVKSHVKHIFSKLDVTTRSEAASRAVSLGLLRPSYPPSAHGNV